MGRAGVCLDPRNAAYFAFDFSFSAAASSSARFLRIPSRRDRQLFLSGVTSLRLARLAREDDELGLVRLKACYIRLQAFQALVLAACVYCDPDSRSELGGDLSLLELLQSEAAAQAGFAVVAHRLALHDRPQQAGNRARGDLLSLGRTSCTGESATTQPSARALSSTTYPTQAKASCSLKTSRTRMDQQAFHIDMEKATALARQRSTTTVLRHTLPKQSERSSDLARGAIS
eukprot:scaffold194_cov329-Prasinococcus_capsulatus_cf.AAC.2